MDTRTEAENIIRDAGSAPDAAIEIDRVALALAAFDRPRVGLGRYLEHMDLLASDVVRWSSSGQEDTQVLSAVLAGEHGYKGDDLTYDDPQNANLMRVIDRRKGLPVALGIIYMATGRKLGWSVEGLNFPGHFLIRLDRNGERAILDPFHGGSELRTPELRTLAKSVQGPEAELEPAFFKTVSNRDVLLRLQNNIKIRRIRSGDLQSALEVMERMRWLAPDHLDLLRETGLVHARVGRIQSAIEALENYVMLETRATLRQQAVLTLQSLKSRLH